MTFSLYLHPFISKGPQFIDYLILIGFLLESLTLMSTLLFLFWNFGYSIASICKGLFEDWNCNLFKAKRGDLLVCASIEISKDDCPHHLRFGIDLADDNLI